MNDRERLIEILEVPIYPHENVDPLEAVADYLLDNNVIPVVRCKDCIHWYEQEGVCLKIYSDGAVSPYAWQDRNPDDFCSYGERKDNV
jgi:hypothetical protein